MWGDMQRKNLESKGPEPQLSPLSLTSPGLTFLLCKMISYSIYSAEVSREAYGANMGRCNIVSGISHHATM